ncbi:hypothetical protein Deval_1935 [Nitratidesulfovibrio vulgaris RCH1]|nr:hypothetical protein Deval_1935 [Nitratidesulfovibrio vulgaris RCH1]
MLRRWPGRPADGAMPETKGGHLAVPSLLALEWSGMVFP